MKSNTSLQDNEKALDEISCLLVENLGRLMKLAKKFDVQGNDVVDSYLWMFNELRRIGNFSYNKEES